MCVVVVGWGVNSLSAAALNKLLIFIGGTLTLCRQSIIQHSLCGLVYVECLRYISKRICLCTCPLKYIIGSCYVLHMLRLSFLQKGGARIVGASFFLQ